MNSLLTGACTLSAMAVAGVAHAQIPLQQAPPQQAPPQQAPLQQAPPQWYPPPHLAHISIHAAPSTQLEVVPSDAPAGTPAVARCSEYCDFWAVPGRYTLYAQDHTGKRNELSLKIKKSNRFELAIGDEGAAAAGVALGIGGGVAFIAGLFMTLPVLADPEGRNDQSHQALVGLSALIAGAIATPIGWTMYASNRTRLTPIAEGLYSSAKPIGQVRVAVVGVGQGGLGLGAVGSF